MTFLGPLSNFNTKLAPNMWARPSNLEFELGSATPEYLKHERGVCLVIGTHPCWYDDFCNAVEIVGPDYAICAVNDAVELLRADHIATCHGEKIEQFIAKHEARWPGDPFPIVHIRDTEQAKTDRPCYRWKVRTWAGSAPFAAAVMVAAGYEQVILCGCPMDGGGGYANLDTHTSTPEDPRIGVLSKQHGLVMAWHDAMRQMVEKIPHITDKIRSMSGATKHIFGGIS